MGLGFEGLLKLDGAVCFATSGTITVLHDMISANGAYGGRMSGSSMATGAPHIYDPWKTTSSAAFDVTEESMAAVARKINNRDKTYSLTMSLGNECATTNIKQYWTDIGFGASVNGLATASIGGVIFEKSNLGGACVGKQNAISNVMCPDLIPYYMTMLGFGGCIQDWNVRITQNVSPIYCCNARSIPYKTHREPDYIVLGEVDITLSVTVADGAKFPEEGGVTATIGNTKINFGRLQLQNVSDNLATGTSLNTSTAEYRAFKFG